MVDEAEEGKAAVLEGESGGVSETQSPTVSPDLKKLTAPAPQGLWGPCVGDARNSQQKEGRREGKEGFWPGGAHGLPVETEVERGCLCGFSSFRFPQEALHLGFADWVQPLFVEQSTVGGGPYLNNTCLKSGIR